jgi:hypothetical protein
MAKGVDESMHWECVCSRCSFGSNANIPFVRNGIQDLAWMGFVEESLVNLMLVRLYSRPLVSGNCNAKSGSLLLCFLLIL